MGEIPRMVFERDLLDPAVASSWTFDWVAHYGFFVFVACTCTVLATLASLWLVYKHLMHYKHPRVQRYIVRIVLMVPVYACTSFLALVWHSASIYLDMVRDCYEAYVLYQFFALLVEFINGHRFSYEDEDVAREALEIAIRATNQPPSLPGDAANHAPEKPPIVYILEAKPHAHHTWPLNYLLPDFQPDEAWLRHVKRMILQYVLVKPALAVLATVLEILDVYDEGSLAPWSGYLYVTIVANASVTVSMYYLLEFYHQLAEELKPLNPVSKLISIKLVLLAAFWQTIVIAIASKIGLLSVAVDEIGDSELDWTTRGLNDFLICAEMLPIAILHSYAYGYKSYKRRRVRYRDWIPCFSILCCPCHIFSVCCNLGHVVSQGDVVSESIDVFNVRKIPGAVSQFSSAVLHAAGGGGDAADARLPAHAAAVDDPEAVSFPGLASPDAKHPRVGLDDL